jgi:uncharacterized protein
MEIVGRVEEQKGLNIALNARNSRLVAVYGRRRVGKTFLIREFYSSHTVFEITALYKKSMPLQLKHFQNTLSKYTLTPKKQAINSWFDAFDALEKFISSKKDKKRKVIFIDEMPYFDTPRSNFLTAFENFWNGYCVKRKDIVLVVCGSSASWIIKKIFKSKGGLHNRVTDKIRLLPFTLNETEQFLKAKNLKWSRYDILQLYMCVGGIPYYLDQIRRGEGLSQFIDRACFDEQGFLYNEFSELYSSLFEESDKHYEIINILSKVKQGIRRDEILSKSNYNSGGNFTKALDELIEAGFVTSTLPFGLKSAKELYRLSDLYTIFYFKFIYKSTSLGKNTWLNKSKGQSFISWCGLAFENICLLHQAEIKSALALDAVYTQAGTWRTSNTKQGIQVDLIIKRADRILHVCEMKFTKSEFVIDKDYAKQLRNKLDIISQQSIFKNHSLFLTFVTTEGVKDNQYCQELVQNEVKMDDLFQ